MVLRNIDEVYEFQTEEMHADMHRLEDVCDWCAELFFDDGKYCDGDTRVCSEECFEELKELKERKK